MQERQCGSNERRLHLFRGKKNVAKEFIASGSEAAFSDANASIASGKFAPTIRDILDWR